MSPWHTGGVPCSPHPPFGGARRSGVSPTPSCPSLFPTIYVSVPRLPDWSTAFLSDTRGPVTCSLCRQLDHAQAVFRSHARGPSCALYRGQLQAECDALWRQGRQICETLSLTGNPCINPVHRLPGETEDSEDEECR